MPGSSKFHAFKGKNRRAYLVIILTFVSVYLFYKEILHEFSHMAVCVLSGNVGKVFFGFPPRVECPGILNVSIPVYFLYNMIPYLFLALPIVLFFAMKRFKTDNVFKATMFYVLPGVAFADTLDNFIFFFVPINDFYNLIAVSRDLFILGGFIAVAILSISIIWIRKYLDMLKGILEKPKDRPDSR